LPTPSLERMCWRPHAPKSCGLSCEIRPDLCPSHSSHDWHVQPSCQRPNRFPPERCAFSPEGLEEPRARRARLHKIRPSSKPFKVTVRAGILSTHWAHRISTGYAHGRNLVIPSEARCFAWRNIKRSRGICISRTRANKPHLPPWLKRTIFGTSRRGRL
jgi:hypothetical protein